MNDELKNESSEYSTEISLNDEKKIDLPIEVLLNNANNVEESNKNELLYKDVIMEEVKIVAGESFCGHCNIL